MLWLYPGVLHGYQPATRWRQQWVLFGGTATNGLTALGHLDPRKPVTRYADPRPVDRASADYCGSPARTTPYRRPERCTTCSRPPHRSPAPEWPSDCAALACVVASVQDYAAELGLTVKQLRDAVRREAGLTPQELVLRTRLSTAKALLAEEELSVAAVARQVG